MDVCVPCARHCTKYRVSAANSVPVAQSFRSPEDQGRRECHYEQLGTWVAFPPWDTGIGALLPTALWLLPGECWDKCSQCTQARRLEGGEGLRVGENGENALEAPDSCATLTFWEPNGTPVRASDLENALLPSRPKGWALSC